VIDEGVSQTYYRDADGDGYGNPGITKISCSKPSGYVANNTDCDDSRSSVRPGAVEVCDGLDNNCNGTIDEGVKTTYYRDADDRPDFLPAFLINDITRFWKTLCLNYEHSRGSGYDALSRDSRATEMAMRDANRRKQQPHVVVNLRHRAHCRARTTRNRLLFDGNRRRQSVNRIDIGFFELIEKLAGISGKRLDVASLSFGVDRVKSQGRLA